MNKRIQELSEQAWRAAFDEVAYLNRIHNRSYSQDDITDIFEVKFAELIVQDCLGVLKKRYMGDNNREDMEVKRCIEDIKTHFGVE